MNRHAEEAERNREAWNRKPLLRAIYGRMHRTIGGWVDRAIPGAIVEIGSGIGSLRSAIPETLLTDRFFHAQLDLCCDAYRLPFAPRSVSHLVLFDVFHHLNAPAAFFDEAARVVANGGRVILYEPYISLVSALAYGLAHPEPIAWRAPIATVPSDAYYAAQGNATRIFFGETPAPAGWTVKHREAMSDFAYLLSGGFSFPALYPQFVLPALTGVDALLSRLPRLFGARCLVVLERR